MTTFIVVFATVFIVYSVLHAFGVFEFVARPKKTIEEIQAQRKNTKQRKREEYILNIYSNTVILFRGILMTQNIYENHQYYIQRLELRTKYLGRLLTPEEVRGKRAFLVMISLLIIPLGLFRPVLFLIPALAILNFSTYQMTYKMRIIDEDEIIENKFIVIYLSLYSKLRQGSRARLQGPVENYIATLEVTRNTQESQVMLKFAKYFLNLLALYEDHVAVPKLRDNYHSATIINFCNVATQALNGVDNFDNLLTFKMQLTERKERIMRARRQVILKKGERSILAIWIILFIFIAIGWYSKLPTGFF